MAIFKKSAWLGLTSIGAIVAAATPAAHAQEDDAARQSAEQPGIGGAIIVTARKRQDTLIDTPLSIQAFSAEDIEDTGVDSLEDLSRYTSSLTFVNGTQGQGGRTLSEVKFRGLSTVIPTATNQTGSVFVDGVYVLNGGQSLGFEDIERVEVIKGPQSAYFGRATFAGVVNFITRDPADEFAVQLSGDYSPTFDSYAASAAIEGPIAGDVLSARLVGSIREKGAQYTASDGGELGRERTTSLSGTALLETGAFRLKLRGSYARDNDSAPITGYQPFNDIFNLPIGSELDVLTTDGVRTTNIGRNLYRGAIPFSRDAIDSNTILPVLPAGGPLLPETDVFDVLVNNATGSLILADALSIDGTGLRRNTYRFSAVADYDLSDALTFSAAFGYNDQKSITIRDTDATVRPQSFQATPLSFEDTSAEARLTFDNGGRLRALIGVNYYTQEVNADFDNGYTVNNQFQLPFGIIRTSSASTNNENDEVDTFGIFGGVDFDIADWLTIALEGRYQWDDVTSFTGSTEAGNLQPVKLSSDEFTPRVILTAEPMPGMTLYASYSKGVLPGEFNSGFLALNAEQQADVIAVLGPIEGTIGSEELENYEIGWKQDFGRAFVSLALYHMKWKGLKGAISGIVPALAEDGLNPVFSASTAGNAEIDGFEIEAGARPSDAFEFGLVMSYNDAKFTDFPYRFLNSALGLGSDVAFQAAGNTLPLTPDWQVNVNATFTQPIGLNWEGYVRGDVNHTGRQYIDQTNLAYVASYETVNLRAGAQGDTLMFEVYAKNLLDKEGWSQGRRFTDISQIPLNFGIAGQGAFLTPIDRREIGVRGRIKF